MNIQFEYFIYIKLKNNKNVNKIEKLNLIFVLFITNTKNNFSFIFFANVNSMINISNIYFDEIFNIDKTFQLFKQQRQ